MSMLLLEKLQKKPVPKEIEKPVAIKLGSEQVEVQIEIEDQSSTANFDISLLKERIKRKGLAAPRIEVKVDESDKIRDDEQKGESEEPEKVDIPVSKPKIKSTFNSVFAFFNSSDSSWACLNSLAFLACFCKSNRFFFFDAKISFNLSKFLLVESSLLLVSCFLALIPDIPAASSNIFLRSIGF